MEQTEKKRAPRNRTLTLSAAEEGRLMAELSALDAPATVPELLDRVLCGRWEQQLAFLPDSFVDLLILDPPYNLDKKFGSQRFRSMSNEDYVRYLDKVLSNLRRLLKPDATIYLCCDWQCSAACFAALFRYFTVRNRIVWEREKGRSAQGNWKNCCEDIWFATVGKNYKFHADAVKLRRRVLAPYRNADGDPKDWESCSESKFRMTGASNFWDDISVPYWSMPENTDHPTQKPEKLLAKLILASTDCGDVVFDPFLGSGTTAVVAKKLHRHFLGIELEPLFCCWALARLERAEADPAIQGYENGVFWERNSRPGKKKTAL